MTQPITRRQFLRVIGTSLLISQLTPIRRTFAANEHILVIGAGIAGLGAARSLVQNGYTVTILEARDKIGGRIRTDISLGSSVDLGASFIHGTKGNPLVELAQSFGLETYDTNQNDDYLVNAKGKFISSGLRRKAQAEFDKVFDALLDMQEELRSDRSIQSVAGGMIKEVRLKHGNAIGDILSFLLKSNIGIEFGADLKEMSLWYMDADEEFRGPDLLLMSGYIGIIDGLAQGLDVRLNQHVAEIAQIASGVQVTTSTGTFDADRAIVTLPLGVLKRGEITFSPELTEEKTTAISRLKMGVLDKTYFKFPSVFWQSRRDSVGYIGNVGARSVSDIPEYFTLDGMTGLPLLFGFTAGAQARRFELLDDTTVIEKTMNSFRRIFGSAVPDPETILRTSWATDPYSYGSYSFIPVRSEIEDYDALAEPMNNRILFAGEATNSKYPGTVHGAYLSGIREANRIINRFS